MTAYNQALDQADALAGALELGDGQRWHGQAVDGKDVRGAGAHGTHTFFAILSLLRFHGWSNIAAAARNYASHPQRALRLIGVPAL